MLGILLYEILTVCLVKSLCKGFVGGKAVSMSVKNSFPILLFTFLENGGLNQVTGFVLHFFFFLFVRTTGGSYLKVK